MRSLALVIPVFYILATGALSVGDQAASTTLPANMVTAGAEVLAAVDPQGFGDPDKAAEAAAQVHNAMLALAWQPAETAPKDRVILLGLKSGADFKAAIGYWEVHDEPPFDGGRWTTTVWWGALPTHWTEIPPAP